MRGRTSRVGSSSADGALTHARRPDRITRPALGEVKRVRTGIKTLRLLKGVTDTATYICALRTRPRHYIARTPFPMLIARRTELGDVWTERLSSAGSEAVRVRKSAHKFLQ
jgi:hypothetical protein